VRRARLVIGMVAWTMVMPILKRLLPLRALARLMWRSPRLRERDPKREAEVVALVDALFRHGRLPRRHNCLERSLIMYRYLSSLNAAPALIVALNRDSQTIHGHAWVLVGGKPVAEDQQVMEGLETIVRFGPGGVVEPVSEVGEAS